MNWGAFEFLVLLYFSMECDLPIFKWWFNAEATIAVSAQIVGGALLCVLQIGNIPILVHLKDIRKNRIGLLNGTGFVSVEFQILNSFEHVV